jgi:thiamine pyrophosphokinase
MANQKVTGKAVLIVSGGTVSTRLLAEFAGKNEYIIGVDRGLEALDKAQIVPDLAIGDFDSAPDNIRKKYADSPKTIVLNPMKDLTDTHAALEKAIELKPESITILGATGSRIDHLLGNISVLVLPLKNGIDCFLVDEHNRIRLIDKSCIIKRSDAYGKYISLLPFGERAGGITLKGFAYGLDNACISLGETIGISNELREEEGLITVEEGYLLVMETKD